MFEIRHHDCGPQIYWDGIFIGHAWDQTPQVRLMLSRNEQLELAFSFAGAPHDTQAAVLKLLLWANYGRAFPCEKLSLPLSVHNGQLFFAGLAAARDEIVAHWRRVADALDRDAYNMLWLWAFSPEVGAKDYSFSTQLPEGLRWIGPLLLNSRGHVLYAPMDTEPREALLACLAELNRHELPLLPLQAQLWAVNPECRLHPFRIRVWPRQGAWYALMEASDNRLFHTFLVGPGLVEQLSGLSKTRLAALVRQGLLRFDDPTALWWLRAHGVKLGHAASGKEWQVSEARLVDPDTVYLVTGQAVYRYRRYEQRGFVEDTRFSTTEGAEIARMVALGLPYQVEYLGTHSGIPCFISSAHNQDILVMGTHEVGEEPTTLRKLIRREGLDKLLALHLLAA